MTKDSVNQKLQSSENRQSRTVSNNLLNQTESRGMLLNKSSWHLVRERSIYNCLLSYVLLQVKVSLPSTYFYFLLLSK